MRKLMLAGALMGSLGLASVADTAGAQPYYHHYHHRYYHRTYYRNCGYERHRAGAIGAVAGAIGGGIIGSAITHGRRRRHAAGRRRRRADRQRHRQELPPLLEAALAVRRAPG